jgi:hypothetical protein
MANKNTYNKPRPKIPVSVQRVVKVEARHACMVCKERVSLQLHHIDENRENNDPSNIVYSCSNCHGMCHDGKITAAELRIYKQSASAVDEEITKLKQALEYYQGNQVYVSATFADLKLKYQKLINDFSDKLIFYQGFVFLVPQFYLDQRGEPARSLIRELLEITPEEEMMIISHLKNLGLVEVIGDLVALKNNDDAKAALNELINSKRIDLSKILEKFSNL